MYETQNEEASRADRLLQEYARTKSTALRDEIVAGHLKIAGMVAGRFAGKGVDYDDLYQVACLAMVRALERYDPDRGVKFSSFVVPVMIGEIKHYFRDRSRLIRLPRTAAELLAEVEKAISVLAQKLMRQPNVPELAEYLNCGEEQILEALELRGASAPASLDYTGETEETEHPLSAFLGVEEAGFRRFETNDTLRRLLQSMDEQQRRVIELRFFEGLSQREAAQRLGISQMSVSRSERKALEWMRGQLQDTEG